MGTNYYAKTEKCPTCGHKPEPIHLGKSSGGWKFSFQYNGGMYYKSNAEMKEWLKDKMIIDEYGSDISHKDFWKMVEKKQKQIDAWAHAEYYPSDKDFMIDGYSFTNCQFC